jgi:hypothetical protein
MSQRALRGRTVDIASEEMGLGSREKSPDLEELEAEGVRLDVDEVNNEAKGSQRVLEAEIPDLQTGRSDEDQNNKGDETHSSEMAMMMNMMQQLLQKTDQQFQEVKNGQKQAQEKMEERFRQAQEEIKQAQEKTGQQFQGLKEE